MPPSSHRIRPEWPDTLVYEEDAERTLRFDCCSPEEPPVVVVPAPELWSQKMPAWAHTERALILARLRAANCVVCEEGATLSKLTSLDGSLEVELERIDDDRTGPWQRMSVRVLATGDVLASTISRGTPSNVRFPRAGIVLVAVTDRFDQPRTLQIDALARTFCFSPDAQSWPLSELHMRLGNDIPIALHPVKRSLRSDVGTSLGSVLLSAAGVWMAVAAETSKERVLGSLCALFFAACAVAPWFPSRK